LTGQADHGLSEGHQADPNDHDESSPSTEYPKADQVTYTVPVAALRPADSPRLIGEDAEHIRVLAEPDRALPPILVHRSTMRIIDGMHRLGAARLRGQETIDVVFFDGSEEDAFVLAVKANVAHGLPLSYADREAAVARIVISHPNWSDRAIAAAAGLGPRTVAAVRGGIEGLPQGTARLGRDGRVRPLDSTDGRRVASQLIAAFPDASLRAIARAAGIAPATVRDVRERIQRGEDPVPPRRPRTGRDSRTERRDTDPSSAHDSSERLSVQERNAVLRNLERDPSLRFAQTGARTLRWLVHRVIAEEEWRELIDTVPPHSVYILSALARRCANEWIEFARQLEQRVGS